MADEGAYIPTTYIWSVDEIREADTGSEQFKELIVQLYQNINQIQLATNVKDSALYDTEEFVNGQTYWQNYSDSALTHGDARRQVFRKVIDFGALPNSTTKSVAHNIEITGGFSFTRLYGAASDQANKNYVAIPNASITLAVDATNVKITTSGTYSTYTVTYVVLEYLKQ